MAVDVNICFVKTNEQKPSPRGTCFPRETS